jgi:hypothetical protein
MSKMYPAVQFTILGTRFPDLKCVCIGFEVLLVSKEGVIIVNKIIFLIVSILTGQYIFG